MSRDVYMYVYIYMYILVLKCLLRVRFSLCSSLPVSIRLELVRKA